MVELGYAPPGAGQWPTRIVQSRFTDPEDGCDPVQANFPFGIVSITGQVTYNSSDDGGIQRSGAIDVFFDDNSITNETSPDSNGVKVELGSGSRRLSDPSNTFAGWTEGGLDAAPGIPVLENTPMASSFDTPMILVIPTADGNINTSVSLRFSPYLSPDGTLQYTRFRDGEAALQAFIGTGVLGQFDADVPSQENASLNVSNGSRSRTSGSASFCDQIDSSVDLIVGSSRLAFVRYTWDRKASVLDPAANEDRAICMRGDITIVYECFWAGAEAFLQENDVNLTGLDPTISDDDPDAVCTILTCPEPQAIADDTGGPCAGLLATSTCRFIDEMRDAEASGGRMDTPPIDLTMSSSTTDDSGTVESSALIDFAGGVIFNMDNRPRAYRECVSDVLSVDTQDAPSSFSSIFEVENPDGMSDPFLRVEIGHVTPPNAGGLMLPQDVIHVLQIKITGGTENLEVTADLSDYLFPDGLLEPAPQLASDGTALNTVVASSPHITQDAVNNETVSDSLGQMSIQSSITHDGGCGDRSIGLNVTASMSATSSDGLTSWTGDFSLSITFNQSTPNPNGGINMNFYAPIAAEETPL